MKYSVMHKLSSLDESYLPLFLSTVRMGVRSEQGEEGIILKPLTNPVDSALHFVDNPVRRSQVLIHIIK